MTHGSGLTRRRALGLAAAGAGALALPGCVSAREASNALRRSPPLSPEQHPTGQITIVDDNTNLLYMKGQIARFTAQTGIAVTSYSQGNFNDLHDRYATLFAAQDSSVDVVMTWAGFSAEFGQAGWLQELATDAVPTDLIKPALDSVSWRGKVYGLPKFSSVQTMFWSKPAFERAGLDPDSGPATWNEFVAAAKKLSGNDRYGFACDIGNPSGAYQNFLRLLLLNGGTMYDEQYRPVFNDERGVEALTRMVELLRVHKVMDPASLQITNSSDLNDLFARGQIPIVFNWPAQYAAAVKPGSTLTKTQVGNGLLPGMSVRSASIDGSEGFAINTYSRNKQAALAWLRFAASEPVQKVMVATEGWFPVSRPILTDPTSVEALPVMTTYQRSTQYVTKRFGVPWSSELDQLMAVMVSNAMNGKARPKDALDDAARKTATLSKRYFRA